MSINKNPWNEPRTPEAQAAEAALFVPREAELVTSMPCVGGTNAYVEWKFKPAWRALEIIEITDVQFGSVYCIEKKLREFRSWLLAKPNRYCVWGGDMVEAFNFTKSPGSPYEQRAAPSVCVDVFVRFWAPAAHRVLGYVGGNHERRFMAYGSIGEQIAKRLRIPFAHGRQHIAVYFGEHKPFKISVWHGGGSARTRGSIVNLLERQAQADDADLFLMGHLHQSNVIELTAQRFDAERRTMELRHSWAAMGSSFLAHHGSYADIAGYRPTKVKMPLAILTPNGKWTVSLKG